MIGSGLKKLATENGMKVSNGVAYGALKGYVTTMNEGSGYKQLAISTRFADAAQKDALIAYTNERNLKKEFRILQLSIAPNGVVAVFHDIPGTMKKIRAFIEWFYPLLPQYSATDVNTCPECGCELTEGCWKLINGVAFHLHESCAGMVETKIDAKNEKRREDGAGSYGLGIVGALLGAAIGAVLWAIVLYLGYFASIVGLVIGFLAEKGYNLLRGKQGRGKVVILIFAIIFGVVLGTFAADYITLAEMINTGEIYGSYGDIPAFIIYLFVADPEYMSVTLMNVVLGLVFAGIGVFSLLRRAGKEVSDEKVIDLK